MDLNNKPDRDNSASVNNRTDASVDKSSTPKSSGNQIPANNPAHDASSVKSNRHKCRRWRAFFDT